MIDRAKFFAGVRSHPFNGSLSQDTVRGITAILDEWDRRGLTDLRWLAYMLATVLGECGHNMLPVREGFKPTDEQSRAFVKRKGYGYAVVINGRVYYGRGLVQLTWFDNYRAMSALLGVDLVGNPDLALDPSIAAKIMFEGMIRGTFRKKKLADYFNATKTDWVMARNIINGPRKGETLPDRAEEIAGYGKAFYADLVAANVAGQAAAPAARAAPDAAGNLPAALPPADAPASPATLPLPTAKPADAQDKKEAGLIAMLGAGATAGWQWLTGSGAIGVAVVLLVLALAYWFIVRPVLRRMTALQDFYAKAEAVEGGWLTRLRLALKGIKTLLWSRFLYLAGLALPLLSMIDGVDLSGFLPDLHLGSTTIPASMYQYGALAAIGWITARLRLVTTTPVGQTDLALTPIAEPPATTEAPDLGELAGGLVDKGGRNRGPSQIRRRPALPAPIRRRKPAARGKRKPPARKRKPRRAA